MKAMTTIKESLRWKLEIDDRMIKQGTEFDYLGVNITSSGTLVKKLKPKLKKQQEWLNV